MKHPLDNPIYHGLATGNSHLAHGDVLAKYFPENISPLMGLRDNTVADFENLAGNVPGNRVFILFTPEEIEIPSPWKMLKQLGIQVMVYDRSQPPAGDESEIVDLLPEHVPAMLALTKLTDPGPFLSETIRLGNYRGIFDGNRLVSMAGQRLQPMPYTEISAVCTHPDYTGLGYATKLIADQLERILKKGTIPFLHVRRDNQQAIHVYEKLGFATSRKLECYVIKKKQ
ncbi:MAG TPA: GNAT family N-acetyltransferase [Puia sp.]|nr:GNAT family N-acetyltransferase [Puia sp.]